jgi:photosystem II stability/assembly factor-like uncharacterized protein
MKKLFTLLTSLIFLICNLAAQPQQWFEQTSGVTVQLTSVSKAQSTYSTAWICGYSGTVLKTTNSGQNWLNVSGGGIPNTVSLINIFAMDENNAITAGYQGTNTWVWKTTNAGANWIQVFTEPNGFINAVWMTSNTNGFMTGDPVSGRWSLWKTSNGGNNWDSTGLYLPQAGTEAGYNNSLFIQSPKIWFGTSNTKIYYSSNNGTNWIAQTTTNEVNTYSIWFNYDGTEGLTGGANLLQTSNSGNNWLPLASLGSGNFSGITGSPLPVDDSPPAAYLWYVRGNSNIYFSYTGFNWIVEYTAPAGTYRHICQTNIFYGGFWAVRSNGGISYHIPIMGVQNIGNEIPNHFMLYQNYPNPFNPSTKIRFDTPPQPSPKGREQLVRLVIYDVLGREIATLVNENLQPGTYEVEWSATGGAGNYTSGVYFYKLITNDYSDTRKMVLVK